MDLYNKLQEIKKEIFNLKIKEKKPLTFDQKYSLEKLYKEKEKVEQLIAEIN